jgi:hypothetical protein
MLSVELTREQLAALIQGLQAFEDLLLDDDLEEFLGYSAVSFGAFMEAVDQLRKGKEK